MSAFSWSASHLIFDCSCSHIICRRTKSRVIPELLYSPAQMVASPWVVMSSRTHPQHVSCFARVVVMSVLQKSKTHRVCCIVLSSSSLPHLTESWRLCRAWGDVCDHEWWNQWSWQDLGRQWCESHIVPCSCDVPVLLWSLEYDGLRLVWMIFDLFTSRSSSNIAWCHWDGIDAKQYSTCLAHQNRRPQEAGRRECEKEIVIPSRLCLENMSPCRWHNHASDTGAPNPLGMSIDEKDEFSWQEDSNEKSKNGSNNQKRQHQKGAILIP